jgi:nucleotide-binding universal stress UspA family protein
MGGSSVLLAALVVWLVIGASLAVALGRRGHDPFGWLVLGMLLGPFAVLLAIESVDQDEQGAVEVVAPPTGHPGASVDVLVGFDGSAGSEAAIALAERLFGDRIDRLTLATIVPYDAGHVGDRVARSTLRDRPRGSRPSGVGLEVAHGRPAVALQQLAQRDAYDLIVVGTRADERVHVLGDAAVDLARHSAVPVLLVPPHQTGENDDHE